MRSFERSGNEQLAASLTAWLFKEKGVLRVDSVRHSLKGKKEPPQSYTVSQDVVSRAAGYLVPIAVVSRAAGLPPLYQACCLSISCDQ